MGTNLVHRLFDNPLAMRDDIFFPIEQHFNQVLTDFFQKGSLDSVKAKAGYPKMDISVENNQFMVRAALPGLEEEDIQVEITPERVLRLTGQMAQEFQSPENARYFAKELRRTHFIREVVLPKEVEGDPKAVLKAGILTLAWGLPKVEEKPKTRVISITAE